MITLAYGLPGMGKTLLFHDMIRAQPEHRFFVVEHANDWIPEAPHWRNSPPDNLTVIDDKPPDSFDESGVYVFRNIEPLIIAQLVTAIGDTTYVDDELDLTARRKGWDDSPLRTIVHQGRHVKTSSGEIRVAHIYGACRRPQNLHTDITDIADQVFIFKVQGSRTLKRLLDDSMIEDDEWNVIRNLPKFNARHWPGGGYYKIKPIGAKEAETETKEVTLDAGDD